VNGLSLIYGHVEYPMRMLIMEDYDLIGGINQIGFFYSVFQAK
jgi:hypothetical protein